MQSKGGLDIVFEGVRQIGEVRPSARAAQRPMPRDRSAVGYTAPLVVGTTGRHHRHRSSVVGTWARQRARCSRHHPRARRIVSDACDLL